MDALSTDLLAFVVVLGAIAMGYGKFFGPHQTEVTNVFCEAFVVNSRFKPLMNLTVGITMGLGITATAAYYLDNWSILPIGVLAGIFASNEAAKVHDAREVKTAIADEVVDQVTVTDQRVGDYRAPVNGNARTANQPPILTRPR
jgi:hypothetical protein